DVGRPGARVNETGNDASELSLKKRGRHMLKQHLTKFCGALVACAFALGSPASSADLKMTFAMPTTPAPYLLPFFLAKDLGWLEKAGLTVEEKVVTGDTNCMRAVISGEADTTLIGPNTIMQAIV